MKNYLKGWNNKEGGFLQIIVAIVLVLVLMQYYGVGPGDALAWIKNFVIYLLSLVGLKY